MLNCIYNGKPINYYDFVGTDESKIVENKIRLRELSTNGELFCKGCGEKVTLVSSEKRRKHFRHQRNSDCSYDSFTKERSEFEDVKCFFYETISSQPHDYIITMDKRLSDGSWVDIAFEFPNGQMVVLNFIKRSFPDIKMMSLHAKYYHEMHLPNLWIIDGEPSEKNDLVSMFDKDALLISSEWQCAAIYCQANNLNLLLKFKTVQHIKTGRKFAFEEIPITDVRIEAEFCQPFIRKMIDQTNAFIEAENEQYLDDIERKRIEREKRRAREAVKKAKEAEEREKRETELRKQLAEQRALKEAEEKHKEEIKKTELRKKAINNGERLHKSTGKFIGSRIGGKYQLFDLNDIKVNKNVFVQMTPYTREMFEAKLKEAFAGYAAPIRNLILKLLQATDAEKDLYLDIMSQYRGLSEEDERYRILAYISIESGLREYKNSKTK